MYTIASSCLCCVHCITTWQQTIKMARLSFLAAHTEQLFLGKSSDSNKSQEDKMDPIHKNFQLCESSSCTDLPDLTTDVSYRGYHNFIANGKDAAESEESDNEDATTNNHIIDKKVLKQEMVNEGIKIMSYAVRGPLMIRANELQRQLEEVYIIYEK
jgi:hypothetical protein